MSSAVSASEYIFFMFVITISINFCSSTLYYVYVFAFFVDFVHTVLYILWGGDGALSDPFFPV